MAYLRGAKDLIKADYPHGIRSILRERMILYAMDLEEAATIRKESLQLTSSIVSAHLDPAKVMDVHRKWQAELIQAQGLAGLELHVEKMVQGSVDAIAKLYHAMDNSGFFQEVRAIHRRIHPNA